MERYELKKVLWQCIDKRDLVLNIISKIQTPEMIELTKEIKIEKEVFEAVFQAVNGNPALLRVYAEVNITA